jgi:hypothetical protein
VNKILLQTILIITCLCQNLLADSSGSKANDNKEIIYEYEDVAPIKRQNETLSTNPSNYGPLNVDQYEGDHSFWWYQKHDKKYKFYLGMSLPYNLGMDINDIDFISADIPSDITDASGNTIVTSGEIQLDQSANLKTSGGIGFTTKFGIEYYEVIRFDIEIGSKQLLLDEVFSNFTNGSVSYSLADEDITLMYNYAGANLIFEWPRGIKAISPFAGVSLGGGYFSTSGLGDDFTPYTQANLGFSYRFNDKVVLELSLQSLLITSDFSFTYDATINSITTSGSTTSTYDDLSANVELNAKYNNSSSGDLIINSIVIGYRFLF